MKRGLGRRGPGSRGRGLTAAALFALLAAGCSSILPPPPPLPTLYRLTPTTATQEGAAPALDEQLLVDVPAAPAALDTARIALSRSPNGVDYFANAAWIDRAPLMIQSLIVESLENAGRIRVVARQSSDLRADAVLVGDLRTFEADYRGAGPPELHVQIECRLVRMPDRTVLAVRSFDATAPAAANEMPDIVAGFDEAFHAAMGQIAPWTAEALSAMRR